MPLRGLLTRDVIVASANYAFLALVDMCYRALLPIFLSTPIALGGLELDPPAIGTIISLYGILNCAYNMFIFVRLIDCFGVKQVYLMGITASVPCFSLYPVINYLARNSIEGSGRLGMEVWAAVGLQVIFAVLTCSCYGTCSRFKELELFIDLFPSLAHPRRSIQLHRRRCTQQGLFGSHERTRASVSVYPACDRTRSSELAILVIN